VAAYSEEASVLVVVGDGEQVENQRAAEWGIAIGDRRHQDDFEAILRHNVIRVAERGSPAVTPSQQATVVGISIYDVVANELSPTIGGGVQIALITPETGYQRQGLSMWRRCEDGTDAFDVLTPPVSSDWRKTPAGRHIPIEAMRLASRLRHLEDPRSELPFLSDPDQH